jgi:hypothetical protein
MPRRDPGRRCFIALPTKRSLKLHLKAGCLEMRTCTLLFFLASSLLGAEESLRICDANFRPGMTRKEVIELFRLPPTVKEQYGTEMAYVQMVVGEKQMRLGPHLFGRAMGTKNCDGLLFLDDPDHDLDRAQRLRDHGSDRVLRVIKNLPAEISAFELVRTILAEARNIGISDEPQMVSVRRAAAKSGPLTGIPASTLEILELRIEGKALQITLEEAWGEKNASVALVLAEIDR